MFNDLLAGRDPLPFEQFVTEARAAGLNPAMWLREKHAGNVETKNVAGQLYIRAAGGNAWPVPEEAAG